MLISMLLAVLGVMTAGRIANVVRDLRGFGNRTVLYGPRYLYGCIEDFDDP